jgi:hypothetical protein
VSREPAGAVMRRKRLLMPLLVLVALVGMASVIATALARRQRPSVTGFAFAPRAFSVTSAPSAASAASGSGTRILVRTSRRVARIAIDVARPLPGRRAGGRCVRPAARLRARRPCTRHVSVGSITLRSPRTRAVTLLFGGRVRGRLLAPGRYRATVVATNGGGRRSRPRRATFTVVPAPSAAGFPNAANTGVPAGWTPRHTTNGDLTITTPGTVVDGELVTGNLLVHARDVTIRNSWVYGSINNQQFSGDVGVVNGGLLIEDTDVGPPSGTGGPPFPAILVAGYTARRVHVHNLAEGFRVADFNESGAPTQDRQVVIEDSYVHIERGDCSHNDGIQGFGEPPRTIIDHNTIDTTASGPDCTTGALFIGNDNASLITVTNNLFAGGGFTMRIGGPGPDGPGGTYDRVAGNRVVDRTWGFGPVRVDDCATVADWSDNRVVTVDAEYRVVSTVRALDDCP